MRHKFPYNCNTEHRTFPCCLHKSSANCSANSLSGALSPNEVVPVISPKPRGWVRDNVDEGGIQKRIEEVLILRHLLLVPHMFIIYRCADGDTSSVQREFNPPPAL